MTSGNKKLIIGVVSFVLIAAIFAILMKNRSANQAKAKKNEIQTAFPVKVQTAESGILSENLSLIGSVFAAKEVSLLSETQGRVLSVSVDVGDRVSSGSVIAKVDDEIKKASFLNAEANYEKTKKDLDRYDKLFKEKSGTESQLDQARFAYKTAESQYIIAKRQLEDTKIVSPISGEITQRFIEKGSLLAVNTPIVYIVDISSLKVKVNAAEQDAFKMHIGDAVEIQTDVYPNETFTGKIRSISAKADDAHNYPIEITLANSSQKPLRGGMLARVHFVSVKKEKALIIPREALVGSIRTPQIFVLNNDIVELRNISVGANVDGKIEVLNGLKQGETVVVNGQANLKNNAKVYIVK